MSNQDAVVSVESNWQCHTQLDLVRLPGPCFSNSLFLFSHTQASLASQWAVPRSRSWSHTRCACSGGEWTCPPSPTSRSPSPTCWRCRNRLPTTGARWLATSRTPTTLSRIFSRPRTTVSVCEPSTGRAWGASRPRPRPSTELLVSGRSSERSGSGGCSPCWGDCRPLPVLCPCLSPPSELLCVHWCPLCWCFHLCWCFIFCGSCRRLWWVFMC